MSRTCCFCRFLFYTLGYRIEFMVDMERTKELVRERVRRSMLPDLEQGLFALPVVNRQTVATLEGLE